MIIKLRFRNLSFILSIILISSSQYAYSQHPTTDPDPIGMPETIPPSPEAANLGKYGEFPVDISTGVPNISIPLFNIQSGSLSVPVTLSYHAGGFRVSEKDGWAGLGWEVRAGGQISRSVRGRTDEGQNGFIYNTLNLTNHTMLTDMTPSYVSGSATTVGYELQSILAQGGHDSHSDSYSYSYPGGGGQFFYNNVGEAFTVPYTANKMLYKFEQIEIDVRNASHCALWMSMPGITVCKGALVSIPGNSYSITEFGNEYIATNDNGTSYTFSKDDYYVDIVEHCVYPPGSTTPESCEVIDRLIRSYKLTVYIPKYTVNAPDGKVYDYSERAYTQPRSGAASQNTTKFISTFHLSEITSADGWDKINFEYLTYDESAETSSRFLKTIQLDGTLPPVVPTTGEYFQTTDSYEVKRLSRIVFEGGVVEFTGSVRVDDIYVKDNAGNTVKHIHFTYQTFTAVSGCVSECDRYKLTQLTIDDQVYQLSYETLNVPSRESFDQDHWGFYNGAGNGSLLPDIDYNGTIFGSGAERNTSAVHAKFGVLKKIIYPTKGSTEFEFESNDVSTPGDDIVNDYSFTKTLEGISSTNGTNRTLNFTFPPAYVGDGDPIDLSNAVSSVTIEVEFGIMPKNGDYAQGPEQPIKTPRVDIPGSDSRNADILYNANIGSYYDPYSDLFIQRVSKTIGISTWAANANAFKITSSTNERSYVKVVIRYGTSATSSTTTNWKVGGLRVKSIVNKDNDGSIITELNYDYREEGASTAQLIKGEISIFKTNSVYYDTYVIKDVSNDEEYLGRLIIYDVPRQGITSGNPVAYSKVTEYQVDPVSKQIIGATEYNYDVGWDYAPLSYPNNYGTTTPWNRGNLLKQVIYKADDNGELTKVRTIDNVYSRNYLSRSGTLQGVNYLSSLGVNVVNDRSYRENLGLGNALYDPDRFKSDYYYQQTGLALLTQTTITENDLSAPDKIIKYAYAEDPFPGVLRSKEDLIDYQVSSTGGLNSSITTSWVNKKVYTYAFDLDNKNLPVNDDGIIGSNKMLLLEEAVLKDEDLIAQSRYFYNLGHISKIYTKSILSPSSGFEPLYSPTVSSYEVDTDLSFVLEKSFEYGLINSKLRIKETIDKGLPSTYIWDSGGIHLIASIANAEKEEVAFTSFENGANEGGWQFSVSAIFTERVPSEEVYGVSSSIVSNSTIPSGVYVVSFWAKGNSQGAYVKIQGLSTNITLGVWKRYEVEISGNTLVTVQPSNVFIDELRLHPKNAQMTTYNYAELKGISSVSDPAGKKTNFIYDTENRLYKIVDEDGNILEQYDYHFKN